MTGLLLAGATTISLLAGCGGDGDTAKASPPVPVVRQVQGRIGPLVIGDGYVPEPASPDVAAAYLTLVDTGSAPVRLTDVRSDAAATVMPMTETRSGGVGSMAPLSEVVVPAHGAFRFRPGAAHLMLEQLQRVPLAGATVTLTLTFAPGGTVTVTLPVSPIAAARSATG